MNCNSFLVFLGLFNLYLYICGVLLGVRTLELLNFPYELRPRNEKESIAKSTLKLRLCVNFSIVDLEAVASLYGNMVEVCAFFLPGS